MTVYWIVDGEMPGLEGQAPAFMHPSELAYLTRRLSLKRRVEWLHGRWAAKALLQKCHPDCTNLPLAEILVDCEPGGAPFPALASGARLPGSLSISHSGPMAACALGLDPGQRVGIDIEKIEPRPPGFFEDYFTAHEAVLVRAAPARAQPETITLIWSAKESAFKALGKGLSLDPRSIEITPSQQAGEGEMSGAWRRLAIGGPEAAGLAWDGWWQPYEGYILTLAVLISGVGPNPSGL
jgi:phosphopantetheinyl transferase